MHYRSFNAVLEQYSSSLTYQDEPVFWSFFSHDLYDAYLIRSYAESWQAYQPIADGQAFQAVPSQRPSERPYSEAGIFSDDLRPLQNSFPPSNRNPNTGFRLFPPLITPNFTQIPP